MTQKKIITKIDIFFLVVFSFSFIVFGMQKVDTAVNSGWHDTGWYLKNAIEIRENGGIGGFLKSCLNGSYTEANQHPLYILAISLFAARNLEFFAIAKLVSLFFGLLTLFAIYYFALSFYGRTVAVISVFFIGLNFYMLRESSHVAAEMLLVLTSLFAWYYIIRGFDENKYWLAAGLFAGLSYLSKGSGIFLIFVFVVAALIIYGSSILKNKYFYLFFVAFSIIAFPLLWRNLIVYHNPIYNLNSHVMWLDNWKQTYDPNFANNPPNIIEYLHTHSRIEIFKRILEGSKQELIVLVDMLKLAGYFQWLYVGAFFAFLSSVGFFIDRDSKRRIVNILFFGIFFLFFSWYNPIVADARFILPIMPVLFMLAALAIKSLFYVFYSKILRFDPKKTKAIKSFFYVSLLLIAIMVPASGLYSNGLKNPLRSYKKAPGYDELLGWLKLHLKKNDRYILWPAHAYWFEWYVNLPGESVPFPDVKNFNRLRNFIREHKITVVIVHPETLQERARIIRDYFYNDPINGIVERKPIRGWILEYKPTRQPVPFLIFRIVPSC